MYLVTGGAGFIGSHITAQLVRRGERVRILDNFSTGTWTNLAAMASEIEVMEGDVHDPVVVRQAAHGCEVIFHHSAEVSVPRSVADPWGTYETNVMGTLNVLLTARDVGARRVVFASSSAIYGDTPEPLKHEGMVPSPMSPYASSKLAGEHLCALFPRAYGIEAVALRYFNVYGERQDPDSPYAAVIPRFIATLRDGEHPVIYGNGEQTRDFIYVDDVVDANLKAATAPNVVGKAYNIASGRSVSLNVLVSRLRDLLGVDSQPQYQSARPGDIRYSAASVTAAQTDLDFTSRFSLEEGLSRMIYRSGIKA